MPKYRKSYRTIIIIIIIIITRGKWNPLGDQNWSYGIIIVVPWSTHDPSTTWTLILIAAKHCLELHAGFPLTPQSDVWTSAK